MSTTQVGVESWEKKMGIEREADKSGRVKRSILRHVLGRGWNIWVLGISVECMFQLNCSIMKFIIWMQVLVGMVFIFTVLSVYNVCILSHLILPHPNQRCFSRPSKNLTSPFSKLQEMLLSIWNVKQTWLLPSWRFSWSCQLEVNSLFFTPLQDFAHTTHMTLTWNSLCIPQESFRQKATHLNWAVCKELNKRITYKDVSRYCEPY